MSDTESFESVASSYDDCTWIGRNGVKRAIDRLKAAHEREMEELRKTYDLALAQARDPQRLRGTKQDTFDGAVEALREFRWQHATNDEDAIPYINALKEMHDREIEDAYTRGAATTILQYEQYNEVDNIRKQEYHRGFEDGKHSMDAEHYAVALRLKQIPLDGGSHENLSQIAKAIWHNDFGWTQDACKALRDKLVRLMGGVSKPNFADQAKDLVNTIIEEGNRKLLNDGKEMQDETEDEIGPADDCGSDSDCGYRGRDFHVDELSITDELRRWADANTLKDVALTTYPVQHAVHGILEQLISIADRIDEQFDRICKQQEAVLQETIDGMVNDRDSDQLRIKKLQRQRDEARKRVDELQAMHASLTTKLIDARKSHMEMKSALLSKNEECLDWYDKYLDAFDEHNDVKCERDNLLELLRDARDEYKMLEQMSVETSANFHAMRDRVWGLEAERDELQAKLDGYERADTAESIVRELRLGSITDAQAIERIDALRGAK